MKKRFATGICLIAATMYFGNLGANASAIFPNLRSEVEISQPSAVENDVLSKYTKYIEYCIRLALQNNNITGIHKFAMQFNVERDGSISTYDILYSSDSEEYDKTVMQSIIESSPFKPFPHEIDKSTITYQVHFNGGDVDISTYASPQVLSYSAEYQGEECKTVNIEEAKSVRTINLIPYSVPFKTSKEINDQIKQNWYPPMQENSAVGISFTLYPDGHIGNAKLFKSSNFDAADDAAIKAIKSLRISPWQSRDKRQYANIKYGFHVEDTTN